MAAAAAEKWFIYLRPLALPPPHVVRSRRWIYLKTGGDLDAALLGGEVVWGMFWLTRASRHIIGITAA